MKHKNSARFSAFPWHLETTYVLLKTLCLLLFCWQASLVTHPDMQLDLWRIFALHIKSLSTEVTQALNHFPIVNETPYYSPFLLNVIYTIVTVVLSIRKWCHLQILSQYSAKISSDCTALLLTEKGIKSIFFQVVHLLIQVTHMNKDANQCSFSALQYNIQIDHPTAILKTHLKLLFK